MYIGLHSARTAWDSWTPVTIDHTSHVEGTTSSLSDKEEAVHEAAKQEGRMRRNWWADGRLERPQGHPCFCGRGSTSTYRTYPRSSGYIFDRTFSRHGESPLFPLSKIRRKLVTFTVSNQDYTTHLGAAPSKWILSLKDPSSKMSESSPANASYILLTDTGAQIKAKICGAITDSAQGITYDFVSRSGTSNLLTIPAACIDCDVVEVAKRYANKGHEI